MSGSQEYEDIRTRALPHVLCKVWFGFGAEYYGHFLSRNWVPVNVDSSSHCPEMYFTTSAEPEFIMTALRKTFSPEGVPQALIISNENQFTPKKINSWLKETEHRHLLATPMHLKFHRLAKTFDRTLKCAMKSFTHNPNGLRA